MVGKNPLTTPLHRAISRAVVSLTVLGGQEFHFPHFLTTFRSIFPQTLLIFFLILTLRVGESPTREGPGYATGDIRGLGSHVYIYGAQALNPYLTLSKKLNSRMQFQDGGRSSVGLTLYTFSHLCLLPRVPEKTGPEYTDKYG